METMLSEEVGQTGPLQVPYSQLNSMNHDAIISDKQTGPDPELHQKTGQRLEEEITGTTCTTVAVQSLFEDVSMDGETVATIEGDSPPVCSHGSSLLVFEDISMDGSDSHVQLVGQDSNLTQNVFKPLFSSSAVLHSESSKVGSDSLAPTLGVNGIGSVPTKTEGCHDLNFSDKATEERMTPLTTAAERIKLEKTQHSVPNGVKQDATITIQETDADTPSGSFHRRKRNHPTSILNEDTIMEHSGLEELLEKRARVCAMDDAIQCLKPEKKYDDSSSPEIVARELARCLHEPKYKLLLDVVRVLGAEKAMEMFEKTAQIQEDGGVLTSQGDKKRAPGGVFLTLVKDSVTPEQRKEIFRIDKEIRARKVKEEKKRKANERWRKERQREVALMKQKAEWELQKFRTQLEEEDFEEGQISEVESNRQPRKDLNMHKRFPALLQLNVGREKATCNGTDSLAQCLEQKSASLSQTTVKVGGGLIKDAMEVSRECTPVTNSEFHQPQAQDKLQRDKNVALAEEKLAAEEFEQMNERDLDFGICLD